MSEHEMRTNDNTTPETLTHEQFAKFHVPVSIAAALAVVVICLIRRESLFVMASFTSIAIVTFWVLGNIVRYYLQTRAFPPPVVEEVVDSEEEIPEEDSMEEAPEETAPPQEEPTHDYTASE